MSRETVLTRIYDALGRTPTTPAVQVPAAPPAPTPAPTSGTLVDLLEDRLVDYNAHVVRVGIDSVAEVVATRLENATRVVIPHDLPAEWVAETDWVDFRMDSVEEPLSVDDLDSMDAVLTGATVAIADTGTICLAGSTTGRRAITLVPDYHIVVLKVADVVETVPHAVAELIARGLETSAQTWVSGPSATVDIELERVKGVHGPRTLDVILLDEE